MENYKKYKNISIIIIIIIILLIITATGIYYYKKQKTKTDTKKFEEYINNNYNTTDYDTTYYTIIYNSKQILTKTIKLNNKDNSSISLTINKNNEIEGELALNGQDKYGNEGVSYLKSTYKNNTFNCELISNDGYKARCDLLKKYSEKYKEEIKELLHKNKTKLKYINPIKKDKEIA